jgi:uncharacterized membrane protein YphA (DoxX/SURF4 family)
MAFHLPPMLHWLCLLLLCAAYLQGGCNKAADFAGAKAELAQLGLAPAGPLAGAVMALELGAPVLILTGFQRWLGALALAGFTLLATGMALRFWTMAPPQRRTAANAFFEHLGLAGGLLLVAWHDWQGRMHG